MAARARIRRLHARVGLTFLSKTSPGSEQLLDSPSGSPAGCLVPFWSAYIRSVPVNTPFGCPLGRKAYEFITVLLQKTLLLAGPVSLIGVLVMPIGKWAYTSRGMIKIHRHLKHTSWGPLSCSGFSKVQRLPPHLEGK
jgi:hypothetical protein